MAYGSEKEGNDRELFVTTISESILKISCANIYARILVRSDMTSNICNFPRENSRSPFLMVETSRVLNIYL